MDGSVEKGNGDMWMGVWRRETVIVYMSVRRERAMYGWECGEGKVRCVDGSVEKGMSDESTEEWRTEGAMSGWECGEGKGRLVDGYRRERAIYGWE